MRFKYSNTKLVVMAVIGLTLGVQGSAHAEDWLSSLFGSGSNNSSNQAAPDQRQIDADLAFARQYHEQYLADSAALQQAYRSGNRQSIQDLQTAVNADIVRLQANAQDLAKDGVSNPYSQDYQNYNPTRPDRRWDNRGSYPGYQQPNNWNNNYYNYNHPGWNNGRKEGWNGQNVPPGQQNSRWHYDRNDRNRRNWNNWDHKDDKDSNHQ